MSKDSNPEIELMIIDSLDTEFKQAGLIAEELQLEESYIIEILQALISQQQLAIDQKGTAYRLVSEDDDDYIELDDE